MNIFELAIRRRRLVAVGLAVGATFAVVGNASNAAAATWSPVPAGYSAVAFNAAQGPAMTDKQSAALAYMVWKRSGANWSDFAAKETSFDSATTSSALADPILTSGGSRATAAMVSNASGGARSGSLRPLGVIQNYIQEPESKENYCGPAAAMQILVARGFWTSHYNFTDQLSQPTLATTTYLSTDHFGGTNWSPQEMGPTLNKWTATSFYVTTAAPTLANIEADTEIDVDGGYSYADNIVETASGPSHLSGYPTNSTKQHWQSVYGYSGSGTTEYIADPAYSPYVTWGHEAGMSAYRTVSASQVVSLVASRGIVW